MAALPSTNGGDGGEDTKDRSRKYFKAGKVKHFIDNWQAIASDKTVLETLCGYELSFHTVPPTRNKCNNPSFN